MADNENPNGQTQSGNDQTDYKTQYLELSAKIANGEYVAKNVYTGLQTKHEKEVLAHKADVDALSAANQKALDLDGALKTLQGQHGEINTKFEATSADLLKEQAKNKRIGLIIEKFPDLIIFEGQGLLPMAGTDEELIAKLTKFQELHGAAKQQKKQEQHQGSTPGAPGSKDGGETTTSQELLDKARAFQRAGKYAEYNQTMNEYYKSIGK